MATSNEYLLKALMDSQEEDYEENPYFMYGQRALMTPMPLQTRMSPWETLLTGALQGFGGGMLKGMGEAQIAEEQAKKAEAIAQLASTTGDERYTLMEADPDLRKIAPMARLADAFAEQEQKAELQKLITQKSLDRNITELGVGGGMVQKFSVNPITGEKMALGDAYAQFSPNSSSGAERFTINDPATVAANAKLLAALYPEMAETEIQSIAKDRDLFKQYGVQSRAEKGFDLKDRPPDKFVEAVGEYVGGKNILDNLKKITKEGNDSIVERNIKQLWPETDEAFLSSQLSTYAGIARNLNESGVMTDQDYNRWTKLLSFKPLDTPTSVARRLAAFGEDADRKIQGKMASYSTKYDTSKLEDLLKTSSDTQTEGGGASQYSVSELKAAGYTDSDIRALSAQGRVK